jgi:hypothetical protein
VPLSLDCSPEGGGINATLANDVAGCLVRPSRWWKLPLVTSCHFTYFLWRLLLFVHPDWLFNFFTPTLFFLIHLFPAIFPDISTLKIPIRCLELWEPDS